MNTMQFFFSPPHIGRGSGRGWGAIATALAFVVGGFVVALMAPTFLALAVAMAALGASYGTRHSVDPSWPAMIRSVLLAIGIFGYPLFLGGTFLPWLAVVMHSALLVVGWRTDSHARDRIAIAHAFAIALAVSLSAAATQFFFPPLWRWVAVAAVAMFLVTLVTTVPGSIVHRLPEPAVAATVLVLSEGLVLLHQLPTHWAVNGAVIALGFAALLESARVPRLAFASLLVTVLLFGTLSL
ncbi:hypothetical protein HY635_01375 [Candidatus Uhrbacteria bacterium]|nr:hypothetical protein [Candidatus Uhrbacteria bacterium]